MSYSELLLQITRQLIFLWFNCFFVKNFFLEASDKKGVSTIDPISEKTSSLCLDIFRFSRNMVVFGTTLPRRLYNSNFEGHESYDYFVSKILIPGYDYFRIDCTNLIRIGRNWKLVFILCNKSAIRFLIIALVSKILIKKFNSRLFGSCWQLLMITVDYCWTIIFFMYLASRRYHVACLHKKINIYIYISIN